VPCWCRLDCRVAIYPGVPAGVAAQEIRDRLAAFARTDRFLANNPPLVTFNGFHAEGYVQEPGTDAENVLARAHRQATGKELESFMSPAYLDARVHALYDKIPALCYGPIARNIHGIDERVSLASVKRITGTMALFVAEWCGLEPC
jgi:acetylornithine deacetylase